MPVDPGRPVLGRTLLTAAAGDLPAPGPSGGLGELEGIRPYVPGDRLSLLYWPSKARYGAWFVRQFGGEEATAVALVLDDRAGVHRRADFERLVSAVLWVVDGALADGTPVLLCTLSGGTVALAPTDQGRAESRRMLAEVQPTPAGSRGWTSRTLPEGAIVLTSETGAVRLLAPTAPIPGTAPIPARVVVV
jgi:uncharacterized protein (DUF58 family)